MAQYINREKLLKRMEGYCEANCGCKPYEDALCPSCGLGDAIYMVEEQRIVNSKNMRGRKDATVALSKMEKTTHWIPVTERLPKCNGCYLVWRPHFFGGEIGMPSICYFDGSNTWHDSYGVDFERILHPKDVTHWMPLPEPPKEGET